jgi:hypothetical protein
MAFSSSTKFIELPVQSQVQFKGLIKYKVQEDKDKDKIEV